MKKLKRYGILASLMLLASCSYFETEEVIEVTSKDLSMEEPIVEEPKLDAHSVENIIYRQSEGAVQIYNLDVSKETAAEGFGPSATRDSRPAGAVDMAPSVEIYPIDVPMQKTLKPVQ